jgi:hypothetical protein
MFGFHTYPSPHPTVNVIKIRLEETVEYFRKQRNIVDIDVYLRRPDALKDQTYIQFSECYRIVTSRPKNEDSCFKIDMGVDFSKSVWIVRRRAMTHIARIETVSYSAGELWFLRLIFLRRPVRDYEEARRFNSNSYETYQRCAVASGYVHNP